MLPATSERVAANTPNFLNRRIRRDAERRVRAAAGQPDIIAARLRELDREWDIERVLEANASALSLAGIALGLAVDRRWLALPAIVAGFLFQHALQGWCPPVPVLRRLGVRTASEIDEERMALKALRGDFSATEDPDAAIRAARG